MTVPSPFLAARTKIVSGKLKKGLSLLAAAFKLSFHSHWKPGPAKMNCSHLDGKMFFSFTVVATPT